MKQVDRIETNTNDLYIHYMDKSRDKGTSKLTTKKLMYLKIVFPALLQQFLKCMK